MKKTRAAVMIQALLHHARFLWITLVFGFSACGPPGAEEIHRPIDPWAFRSVLDKQPRMLTIALDSSCYLAYDLSRCTLYKAWKGGVTMEGAAYTDKKNVQPTSWGISYFLDSLHLFQWKITRDNQILPAAIVNTAYSFHKDKINLHYAIPLTTGDTIRIEEQPTFRRDKTGKPVLVRMFSTESVPSGIGITLQTPDSSFLLPNNKSTQVETFFNEPPHQFPPEKEAEYDHRGRYWIEKSDCLTCHEADQITVGPSFQQIAGRYPNEKTAIQYLIQKIKTGGSGVWGNTTMNGHPNLSDKELRNMIEYIFTLAPPKPKSIDSPEPAHQKTEIRKPGFGAPLEGLHPGYKVTSLHSAHFKPRVGGLAFLPDGRLLVTTWDTSGSVYLLSGVETGDTAKVSYKRIAFGLAEPLGITVVDGEIYVMQKQELTRLVDRDGDDITDEYQVVCNQWTVTDDFHEFGFGLVYKDGYFYATLSMAMRLLSDEKQRPDRGKTIKISRNGKYEWVNYGLRTPNGIGLGPDNELFVTDNQGEWVPANKLIHVRKGDYHGMQWGLPDSLLRTTPVSSPAIWLPEDEIANSPSQPVLMKDGPYKGQMLHGDVTHGGIKRDFLEKIKGAYQGAVFRFSQGLEAGVNRMVWGPDGALYVGEIGMVGGWSWKERKYGLQRMVYTGDQAFEMLAIRAKPKGFEIEFTEPLATDIEFSKKDLSIQQWWYLPTANYGGPKMDLETLDISRATLSGDRKKVYLEIRSLKTGHIIYFRLGENLPSKSGRPLWSSEAWYTLNNIPD